MDEMKKCPKCNGTMIEGLSFGRDMDCYRWSDTHGERVGIKMMFTSKYTDMKSYACEDCGYVERYVVRQKS
jgi:hypothetical protein